MNIYYGFHAVYLIALKCVFTFERLSSLMLGYVWLCYNCQFKRESLGICQQL